MKTYQKLIVYPLMVASLAGLAGCGRETPNKQATDDKPSKASLEKVVETHSPTPPVEISPTLVYNRNELFDLLSKTRGTHLSREQEYADDPDAYLTRERKSFGTDYNDLLSDLINNVSGIKYERAKALIQSAELVARQMNPRGDFKKDLVEIAYKQVAEGVSNDLYFYANRNAQFGKKLAEESGIDASIYVPIVVKAAFDKTAKNLDEGLGFYAKKSLDFGIKLAKDYNISTREYAIPVVQAAINLALSKIKDKTFVHASRSLEFGKEVAKANGLEDFLVQIDQISATMRR